jgi:integrase
MGELIKFDDREAAWSAAKSLALQACRSHHSRRSYEPALDDFRAWYEAAEGPKPPLLSKAAVNGYARALESRGLAPATIAVRLAAIRKLAGEACDNGLMAPELAAGIGRVKGAASHGTRMGNWLSLEQAEKLIFCPDPSTLTGKRDRALFGVLIGCGLRRSEASALTIEHVQQREGRWVIVDLVGKHGRVRSVPMPGWAKSLLDGWTSAAEISAGAAFRSINRGGRISGAKINSAAVWVALRKYAGQIGVPNLAPHDLRRTYAKLAHTGRAALEQIQISLGHSSIQTTERYLGVRQDLQDAPCDHLQIKLPAA